MTRVRRLDRTLTPALVLTLVSVFGDTPSGGDVIMLELVEQLRRRGLDTTVLTNAYGERQIRNTGRYLARVDRLPVDASTSIVVDYLRSMVWVTARSLRLARTLRAQRVNCVVISGSFYPPDLVAGIVWRALGARWVLFWAMDILPPWMSFERAQGIVRGRRSELGSLMTIRNSTKTSFSYVSQEVALRLGRWLGAEFLVLGSPMLPSANRHHLPANRVRVTSFGADKVDDPPPSELAYDAVFLGRFHPQKGLDDLVHIWRLVLKLFPDARLGVAGDGLSVYADEMKRAFRSFPVGSVTLVGAVVGEAKRRFISSGRMLLFPSHYESGGVVVVEAMSSGLPVVGYDIPTSNEIFGPAMIRVPCFDRALFGAEVVKLLADTAWRDEVAQRSRAFANEHTWERIADQLAYELDLTRPSE